MKYSLKSYEKRMRSLFTLSKYTAYVKDQPNSAVLFGQSMVIVNNFEDSVS